MDLLAAALKSFIAEVAGAEPPARSFGEEDYRLARGGLADSCRQCGRRNGPRRTAAAEDNHREAVRPRHERSLGKAVDFYNFTSGLKRARDDDGRQKIGETLWDIAFADGVVDEFEENTIWRIAELLGVSTRDRVLRRQRVAGQMPQDAPFEGPWSASAAKGKA